MAQASLLHRPSNFRVPGFHGYSPQQLSHMVDTFQEAATHSTTTNSYRQTPAMAQPYPVSGAFRERKRYYRCRTDNVYSSSAPRVSTPIASGGLGCKQLGSNTMPHMLNTISTRRHTHGRISGQEYRRSMAALLSTAACICLISCLIRMLPRMPTTD
jgi:hypothetical protein